MQPPKYVTVLFCGERWQIQSGHMVVWTGPTAFDAASWLVFHGYVIIDATTCERMSDHAD